MQKRSFDVCDESSCSCEEKKNWFLMKSDKNDESAENFLASSSSFLQKTNSQHNKRNTNQPSFFCLK